MSRLKLRIVAPRGALRAVLAASPVQTAPIELPLPRSVLRHLESIDSHVIWVDTMSGLAQGDTIDKHPAATRDAVSRVLERLLEPRPRGLKTAGGLPPGH